MDYKKYKYFQMKKNIDLMIFIFLFGLMLSCDNDNNYNSDENIEDLIEDYSEVIKIYDENRTNSIELQITGDNEIHVNSYINETDFSLETFVQEIDNNIIIGSSDLILDDFDFDNEQEEEHLRGKGIIQLDVLKANLTASNLDYKWIVQKKSNFLKSSGDTQTDVIVFTNKRKRKTFSGKIEFLNINYATDDELTCDWRRRWNKCNFFVWFNCSWTNTKTDVLEYNIKEYSQLSYNGKQILCRVTHNYGNYTYSAHGESEIQIDFNSQY